MIKQKYGFILFAIFVIFNFSYTQMAFPTSIGNNWVYHVINASDRFYDVYDKTLILERDTIISGKTYSISNIDNSLPYLTILRADQDNLYIMTGVDSPFLKFNISVGDSYSTSLGQVKLNNITDKTIFSKPVKEYLFTYQDNAYWYSFYVSKEFGFHKIIEGAKMWIWSRSYELKNCKLNDTSYTTDIIKINKGVLIQDYQLYQNFPNPFNPLTKIKYQIFQKGFVKLNIYDVLGNPINKLVDGIQEVGDYEVDFNASSLSSGVYFYQLMLDHKIITKRMLLLK